MGTDIHMFLEHRAHDQAEWIVTNPKCKEVPNNIEPYYMGRWYEVFGELSAGVRNTSPTGFAPRGFPSDASKDLAEFYHRDLSTWTHSTNYLNIIEFKVAVGRGVEEAYLQFREDLPETTEWDTLIHKAEAILEDYKINDMILGIKPTAEVRFVFCFDS